MATVCVIGASGFAALRKVVLTSSIAVVANTPARIGVSVVDEIFLSDFDVRRKDERWYVLSKTLAELAAWDFEKGHNLNMVAVNPSMVLGPLPQPSMNSSNESLPQYLNGTRKTFPNFAVRWIGVEDVALPHLWCVKIRNQTAGLQMTLRECLTIGCPARNWSVLGVVRETVACVKYLNYL